jgi:hypothetical protein
MRCAGCCTYIVFGSVEHLHPCGCPCTSFPIWSLLNNLHSQKHRSSAVLSEGGHNVRREGGLFPAMFQPGLLHIPSKLFKIFELQCIAQILLSNIC